jgi:hypothetical protein
MYGTDLPQIRNSTCEAMQLQCAGQSAFCHLTVFRLLEVLEDQGVATVPGEVETSVVSAI